MKQHFRRASLALLSFAVCLCAYAQKTITGTVKDASGEPLIGATISAGGNAGAVTDVNGKFSLPNVKQGTVLTISYVGYKPQKVTVGNQQAINAILKSTDKSLDEIVVVGYGTMRRKDLTGSVASVSGDKLAQNPVANIAEALQGQLPGVNVISQDGRPGATMSIRVRGGGSITQSNDPLYVVDGIQVSSIDDIPADNIESIDVLKDAASTAIYGARGANGVILITTKSAKEGKTKVKYNVYYQMREQPEKLDVLNAYENVLYNWSYATALGSSIADGVAKYYGLGANYGNHINDYKNVGIHNYLDDVMDNASTWNHDVSISGGNDKTKYYATVNYRNDDGTLKNSGFRRWSANFKLAQNITDNLVWNVDARYSEMQFKGSKYELATQAYRYKPLDETFGSNEPSDLGMGDASADPAFDPNAIMDNYENLRKRYRVGVNNALTWTPIKGLTAKTELYLSRNWSETQNWTGNKAEGEKYNTAKLTKGDGYYTRWSTTLNYDVQGLGENHKLGVLVGNEVSANKSNSSYIKGVGYPDEWDMGYAFANMNMSDKTLGLDEYNNTIGTPSHTLSWFGRINYNFMERYLLTATLRADGSSKFSEDNHWGYFPAVAAGWRISEEPFMESTRDWLDNLKLRVSYGTSGNDAISASLFNTLWKTSSATVDGVSKPTYVPADCLGNPDLKWETTISRNIGLDWGLFGGKLRGTLDFYWNTTEDILMRVPCDPTSGFSYQFQNVGETSNKGVELTLNYQILRNKDWNLSFGMTMSHNVNKVEKLADNVIASAHTNWGSTMRLPSYDYVIKEGQPVGLIQGYRSQGYYTVDDFNVENGVWTLKPGINDTQVGNYAPGCGEAYKRPEGQQAFPGMAKFADVDGDNVATTDDVDIIGEAQPDITGGFNFSGRWKSLDFSANFTYQIGGDIYNANVMYDMMGNKDTGLGYSRLAEIADCWRMYNVNQNGELYAVTNPEELRSLNAGAKYALPYSEYGIVNSEFIEDASYLKLQTLTIGYTLPKTWLQKVGIENVRLYFTGSNLFCLTGYSGLDPEVDVNPHADSAYDGFPTPNYDFRSYPRSRSYTVGLNVTF